MSTPLQRQREREEARLLEEALRVSRTSAERIAAGRALHQHRISERLKIARPPATREQLAVVARHLESIVAAEHVNPETGEVLSVEKTKRVSTLADVMGKDGFLSFDQQMAVVRLRELFLAALGSSKGVSSYGDYVAPGEASKRIPTTDTQMQAYEDLKRACVAAFGVLTDNGKWVLDEALMQIVIPALLSDKKDVTQNAIGRQRVRYTGRAQVNAAGGVIIHEVAQRLALHFRYRER